MTDDTPEWTVTWTERENCGCCTHTGYENCATLEEAIDLAASRDGRITIEMNVEDARALLRRGEVR
jgi:hypothetical protein